jgi:hypothetical protein
MILMLVSNFGQLKIYFGCCWVVYSYLCDKLSKLIFTGALALVGRAT